MFFSRTRQEVMKARGLVERIGKLSDNLFKIGPLRIGIDGLLAWVPGVGDLYSLSAGAMLLMLGLRTRAPLHVLIRVGLLVGVRSAIGAAAINPLLAPLYAAAGAAVDLFRGHKMAADLLVKTIDNTLYVEGHAHDFKDDPGLAEEIDQAKREGMRIVYLG